MGNYTTCVKFNILEGTMYSILQSCNANTEKTAQGTMIALRASAKAEGSQKYTNVDPIMDFSHQISKWNTFEKLDLQHF